MRAKSGMLAMTRQSQILSSVATMVAVLHGTPSFAQTAELASLGAVNEPVPVGLPVALSTQGTARIPGEVGNGDIIVTAQRRSESLQRTPVAVSVVGSDTLQKKGITSQADLQSAVPGLQVKASQSSDQLNYAIRGQSLDPFSSVRPGVLPYFDEIQVGGAGSGAFYDLQSVQVLKGPQGTLFGRNATGGAVLVTSARPENKFGGYISGRLGNYHLRQIEGAINIPLVDDAALLRIAGMVERRDGFQFNLFDNSRVGDVRREAVRGTLLLKPAPGFTNTTVVDYLHSGGSSTSNVIYSIFRPGQKGPGATIDPVAVNVLFSPALDSAIGFPGAWAIYLAGHPGADPDGIIAFTAKQRARGPFVIDVDGANQHRANNLVVSNITTIDVATNTQIKNVFGYTKIKAFDRAEFDGSPFGVDTLGPKGLKTNLRQISEELQLIGKVGPLSYVTGIYFSDEKLDYFSESIIFDLAPFIYVDQLNHTITTNKTLAPYAQGTYDLSGLTGLSGLSATAGIRYTNEKVRLVRQPDDVYATHPEPNFVLGPETVQFKKYSWQLGLQEQLNSVLLYVVSRHSFRSGGFNSIAPPVPGFGNEGGSEYKAETATDVEIGAKYRGTIAGAPLRLNIAAYNLWVKNIQRVTYAIVGRGPAAITVNVPKAKISGVEIDATYTPSKWLNLGGSVNYANGRFTDNLVRVGGGAPVAFGPYPDLPKFSGTAFAEFTAPIGEGLSASLRGDVYHQAKTYFSSAQKALNPGAIIPGYTLVDFRAAIENKDRGWSLAANIKNAFNRVYYVGGLPFESVFTLNAVVPGAPRTFFVQAGYRF